MIKSSVYIISSPDIKHCPNTGLPEYAMIGRSNVGKSSLINLLSNNQKLAKTSKTPGKTKLINYFLCDKNWYLVDMPGYGYSKTGHGMRNVWDKNIQEYLLNRKELQTVFILIDSSISAQKIDLEFITWCLNNNLPFSIIFTKKDKATQKDYNQNIKEFKQYMNAMSLHEPNYFTTSSTKKSGSKEIIDYVLYLNKNSRNKSAELNNK